MKVYLARGMSGRVKSEVVKEARQDRRKLDKLGITPLCPVLSENVRAGKSAIASTVEQMNNYWFRDKQMIREANVVFDMTPELKSEGVAHEIGYARYFLYKPVVRVYKNGQLPPTSSVAFYEDDLIVSSVEEGAVEALRRWGTWYRRILWRFSLYKRCLPGMIKAWLGGWK